MEKICSSCGESKGRMEFNKNKGKFDGLQHDCRACQRSKARVRYESDPSKQIEANNVRRKRNRAENRAKVIAIKEGTPCADCNTHHPSFVMDFDHVRGEKAGLVSEMVAAGVPWAKIEAEIAKCDLVCSNCHRYRTFSREGKIRVSFEEDDEYRYTDYI